MAFPSFFGTSALMGTGVHTRFTSNDVCAQVTTPEKLEVISSSIKSDTAGEKVKVKRHILFPIYCCEKAKNCNVCVALRNLYCAWDRFKSWTFFRLWFDKDIIEIIFQ